LSTIFGRYGNLVSSNNRIDLDQSVSSSSYMRPRSLVGNRLILLPACGNKVIERGLFCCGA